MSTARILLVVCYALAVLFMLIAGMVYRQVQEWSHWAALTCGVHGALTLLVASMNIVGAARIAASSWLGIGNVVCVALLLVYNLKGQGGWLLAAVALGMFTLLVTFMIALLLKPRENQRQPVINDGNPPSL